MFRLLCFISLTVLVAPQSVNTTVRSAPTTRAELVDYMAAQLFSDDDCLTTQEWGGLLDSIDSNGDGQISVQEFHNNDLYVPILGEPYGARAIFIYHDKAMGEPDGVVNVSEQSAFTYNLLDENDNGCVTEAEFRSRAPIFLDEEAIIRDVLKAVEIGK